MSKSIDDILHIVSFKPSKEGWESIKDDVIELEHEAFHGHAYSEEELRYGFTHTENLIVLLRDKISQRVNGYAYTVPIDHWDPDEESERSNVVLVDNIVISKGFRGRGLTGLMLSLLEEKMRSRNYKFFEINANILNGLAANVEKVYKDRIVEGPERTPVEDDEESGSRMYFKIKL